MSPENPYSALEQHLPSPALAYCFMLWEKAPFDLKITRSRQSKVGDFTSRRDIVHPRITLNHDLNPYLFLVTYIHEVAHLHVFLKHRNRVDPHGEEWKNMFKQLMEPLLQNNVFPEE